MTIRKFNWEARTSDAFVKKGKGSYYDLHIKDRVLSFKTMPQLEAFYRGCSFGYEAAKSNKELNLIN